MRALPVGGTKMTREDQISPSKRNKHTGYKNVGGERKKMFPVNDKPKADDAYDNLQKLSKRIYRNVRPAKKELQERLTSYAPKPFGESRTYSQPSWSIYERACSQEKLMFFRILKDAVDYLMIDYEYKGNGRPPVYLADIVKAICIRMYSNYSSWRAESELKIARAMGVIDEVPKRSTLNKYLQSPAVAKLLNKLYKVIAAPLAQIEVYFAADATGISNAYGNKRWREVRHTKEEMKAARTFNKLHIICGVKTNIICSAKVTAGTAHESPHFKQLLDDTAKIFSPKEVSADAGYLSKENAESIEAIGAVPYIMSKRNVNVPERGPVTAWGGMLRLWKHHKMFFAEHYHKRSNVESTFSMMKRKWGQFCRSKLLVSQENEILAKIVCHNSAVLSEALLQYDLKKEGFMATL